MWFSTSEHLRVIVYSFFMGMGLSLLYDVVKLTRILFGICSYSETAKKLNNTKLPFLKEKSSRQDGKKGGVTAFVFVFFGDIIYSLLCGAAYSLFLFHAIEGHVRWYFILSSAFGFFFHYFTLSKFNIIVLEVLFFLMKCGIMYLWMVFFLPFRILYRLIWYLFRLTRRKVFSPMMTAVRYRLAVSYTMRVQGSLNDRIHFDEVKQK